MRPNIILQTDSYKLTHYNQYPEDTEGIYSYFESRTGAEYPNTVFFGLQYLLDEYLEGRVVSIADVVEARDLAEAHFGNPNVFNFDGWMHIVEDHAGTLPLRIKAVPEGTVVPEGNVMMTVENTCPKCYWLTNAVESLLTHVWYPGTVATVSYHVKKMIEDFLGLTADSDAGLPFMLHDFGYRGVSSDESAAMGGAGHLVNFMGTDTLPAMLFARRYYGATYDSLAFSVPATEHSVMTAKGEDGEFEIVDRLLDEHPTGILSVVGDSYDYYRFVETVGSRFKKRVLVRDGVFVIRPDSVTKVHTTPAGLVVWTLHKLWYDFPGEINNKGYKVLDPHVRILWGDGIDPVGIKDILEAAKDAGFSAENLVFGMGGGLLQKVNRDTQRFAFKCSARHSGEGWEPVQKKPLDASKASKPGRMGLMKINGHFRTLDERLVFDDMLQLVFENGTMHNHTTFAEIRERAA